MQIAEETGFNWFQERKKRNRRKDKHGFSWTPFIRDEELPLPRPPQPAMLTPVKPHIRQNGDILTTSNNSPTSNILRTRRDDDDFQNLTLVKVDTPGSQRSDITENSYHTAFSDFQDCSSIGVIPKQVSDSYNKPSIESVAHERKSSVRKLQEQHYSILDNKLGATENISKAPPQKPIRTHTKKSNNQWFIWFDVAQNVNFRNEFWWRNIFLWWGPESFLFESTLW